MAYLPTVWGIQAPPMIVVSGILARAPRRRRGCRGTLRGSSLDYLLRPRKDRRRDREAERLRGLQVDDEVELRGLLDGQVGRLHPAKDLVHVDGRALA